MKKTINNHWQFFWLAIGMSILLSSSAIKPQTGDRILPWMAQTKSQISPHAWQKMTVDVRLLIGAPTDFLALKANVMEVSQIETAEPEVGVLVKSTGHREELEALGAKVGSQIGDIFTIRIPIAKLPELANHPHVMNIAPSLKRRATLDASVVENKAKQVHQGQYTTTPPTYSGYTGKGVIVADISTGIDWRHGDFINDSNNTSRILSIWDQTLIPQSGEKGPAGFSYGVEYTQADINNELDGTPTGYVRSKDTDGHGTHVMGIIAGDGSATGGGLPGYTYVGMAPQADIIVIKSILYDTQILDAVSYAMNKADQFGKPVAFNMSFGGHFGAHDGTSLLEQGIDLAINRGKIVIAVSAGNEGTDAAHGEYIHAEGTVATGSTNTTTFVIPSYTPNSSAGNDFLEFNMWYQGNDNINVKVTTPNGYTWNASTGYDNNAGATATSDGAIYIDNASTGRDINNNDRMCYILIWDYYSSQPPRAGTWTITVTGNNITEGGHYDAWLHFSQVGTNHAYFSASSGSNKELIGIPGTSDKVITVAAHSTKTSWVDYSGATRTVSGAVLNDLAYFSSPGPTRDDPGHIVGRQKPDISASGFGVVAARSADASWSNSSMYRNKDGVHLMTWGTSMSAPHIVGAAALMLEKNPTLTAQEIKSLLTANARADAYTGSVPNLRWGYGKLDIAAVMQQVTPRQQAVDLFPSYQADDALAGTTVSFKARVQNNGATNDSYNLTVSGHSWPTTIWNAAGTSQLSSTGVINARSQLEILIKVQIPAGTQPSRQDMAVIRATSASNATIADQISVVTRTPASLPWSDNFPSTKLDTIKWNFNGGPAEINSLGTSEPSSPYSLNLNGNERGGDEVQSQAIDLSGKSLVLLSYYYQRTGGGNAPESGDDLWVDYYDNSGNWVNLKRYLGSGSSMSSYIQEQILLPATAMHNRFKIRFRNVGTPGPNDDWFIDNVAIAEMTAATIPWTDNFPTTTLDANKWPVNIGPAVVNSTGLNEPSAPYSLDLNGTDEVQSQPIDLAGKANVALLYYYQKKGGGDSPESGNDLYIDYYNSSGNWVNLKQHLGSSTDMTVYQLEYVPLPTGAYHNGFRIRFRTTGDANSDDWFVDDVRIESKLPPDISVTPDSFKVELLANDSTTRTLKISNSGQYDLRFLISKTSSKTALFGSQRTGIDLSSVPAANPNIRDGVVIDTDLFVQANGQPDEPVDCPKSDERHVAPTEPSLTINFDDVSAPSLFSQTVALTSQYASLGVIFAGPGGKDGGAIVNQSGNFGVSGYSAPNFLAFNSTASLSDGGRPIGPETISFAHPVRSVQIKAGHSSGGNVTMQAYNSTGVLIGSKTIASTSSLQTIKVEANGIAKVVISFTGSRLVLDDLVIVGDTFAKWLTFTPDSGTIAAAGSQDITVKFNAVGLKPDSTYLANLIISSNDPDEPLVTVPVQLTVTSNPSGPKHFVFRANTDGSYSLIIDAATLDQVPLQPGDEIGVFTPAGLCVGASVWTGTAPLPLVAWMDDSQTSAVDGYRVGEKMSFRIWDASGGASAEYPAIPTYTAGNGNFGDGPYARIAKLEAYTLAKQTIYLTKGWNWVSTHVQPETLNVAAVTRKVKNLVIMVNGNGQFYIPGVVNGIGNFNPLEGYKVYVSANDSLVVQGQPMLASTPIMLKTDWNLVSYLPNQPLNAEVALANIRANLAIAKNDIGGFYIPGVINTLGNMVPGEGYMLYLNKADTLIYPSGPNLTKIANPLVVTHCFKPAHFQVVAPTDDNYCIGVASVKIDGQLPTPGTEIGIFTESGLCVGGGVWMNQEFLAITAWKDNGQTPEIDGYVPGERMLFKIWSKDNDREIDLLASFKIGDGIFGTGSYALVELENILQPTSYALDQNYPNPFNPETTIKYQLPQPGKVTLTIYNLLGQEIKILVDDYQTAGYHTLQWDGTDAEGRALPSGVYVYRLQTKEFSDTKKLIMLK